MAIITTPLPFPLAYDAEQQAAIDKDRPSWDSDGFVEYAFDGAICARPIRSRPIRQLSLVEGWIEDPKPPSVVGQQYFAVFGSTAYQLFCETISDPAEGWIWDYLPVLIDGCAVVCWPDEGRSGVLHLMRCRQRDHKPCGWAGLSARWTRAGCTPTSSPA